MNKSVILIIFIYTISLYAMEKTHLKETSFALDKTIIKVIKGSVYDADGNVDIIVIGNSEQRMLKKYTVTTVTAQWGVVHPR